MQDCRIAMLWIEGPPSYLEQLCIRSFLDAGHHVTLYHYGPVANVPAGVELCDGAGIMPLETVLVHERSGSPAPTADRFRYRLLAKLDRTIRADTDAYCLRPFTTATGYFFGWESQRSIGNGVFALPRDSDALHALIAFTGDDCAIPEWFPAAERARLRAARDAGRGEHAGRQPWGVWGPQAVTHYLRRTGEIRHALPRAALFPISFRDRRRMLRPGFDARGHVTDATLSIHLYGRRIRRRLVRAEPGGMPRPGCLLDRLLRKHGVDPAAAPLPGAA